MAQKLITRAQFAELAGVSGAAVTKAAAASLKAATSGKFIDADHPDALAYIKKQDRDKTPPAATGLDPLYEQALEACQSANNWTIAHLVRTQKIGKVRARKLQAMLAATEVKDTPTPRREVQISDGLAELIGVDREKMPHVRGTAARKERRKAESDETAEEVPENIAEYADMTLRQIIQKFGTDVRFVDWLKAVKAIEDIQEKRLKNEQTQGNLVNRDLIRTGIIEPLNTAHVKMMTDGAKAISVRVPAMAAAGEETVDIERYISGVISSFIKPVAAKVERTIKNV